MFQPFPGPVDAVSCIFDLTLVLLLCQYRLVGIIIPVFSILIPWFINLVCSVILVNILYAYNSRPICSAESS